MENQKSIEFVVSTLLDLRNCVDDIIDYINRIIEKFTVNQRKPQFFDVEHIGGNIRTIKFSKKSWDNLAARLKEGQITYVILCFQTDEDYKAEELFPDVMLKIKLCNEKEVDYKVKGENANQILFSMKPNIFNIDLDEIVEYFKICYLRFNGVYGYMDFLQTSIFSCVPKLSPIESVLSYIKNVDIENSISGYFWGNILNENHIQKLGGEKYVKDNIPHHVFEPLQIGDNKAYYIQLTKDIFEFFPEKYLSLKEFLKPLLPKEDMETIALYDYSGKSRKLNRLVFNDEESLELEKALSIPQFELMEMFQKKLGGQLSDTVLQIPNPDYERVSFSIIRSADPGNLSFDIWFEKIDQNQYSELKNIIESWIEVGIYGGFGLTFHYFFGIQEEDEHIMFTVDMGSSDLELALTCLENIINQFAMLNGLQIKKFELT